MSEPTERDFPDRAGAVEGTDIERAAEASASVGAGPSDLETSDLSDTGVGLGVGEPNTFEPEEAGPAVGGPTE